MKTPRTDAAKRHMRDGECLNMEYVPIEVAEELERELIAMSMPRPYDCYWSRRALAAEKALDELRALVSHVTTSATLEHIANKLHQ
jgi:hypothetical protein